MEACASSAGPAPSQCLALVPYRGVQSWPWDEAWVGEEIEDLPDHGIQSWPWDGVWDGEEIEALPDPIPVQPDACELPVSILVPEAVGTIEDFVQSAEKPQDEEQKAEFLQSICTVCNTAAERELPYGLSTFCHRSELAEKVMELLLEEPRGKISLRLWQLAMAAIIALSTVKMVLENKMRLFTVCFATIFSVTPGLDLSTNSYMEAMSSLERMLHTVVFVRPMTSIGKELQGIFKALLPFTNSNDVVARHGAVGLIWKLSQALVDLCRDSLRDSSGQNSSFRFQHLHVPVLGELVGKLVLCCSYPQKKTRYHALRALRQLYAFVLERNRWELRSEKQNKSKERQADLELRTAWTTNSSIIVANFVKHLHFWENTDLLLAALKGMEDSSSYDTQAAVAMLSVVMVHLYPAADEVQRIVEQIRKSRMLVTEQRAQRSIKSALCWLTDCHPDAVTRSLLRCCPVWESDAWELWLTALSMPSAVPEILQELLRVLGSAPLKEAGERGELPVAAASVLHRLLRCRRYEQQLQRVFPGLFLELIFQLLGSADNHGDVDQPSPAVRTLQDLAVDLLLFADLEKFVKEMEARQLWKRLLPSASCSTTILLLASVMFEKLGRQRSRVFAHLQQLLLNQELQWREARALQLYMALRIFAELREEDANAERIFRKSLGSQQLQSRRMAGCGLRALYSQRLPLLLPDVLSWLRDPRADLKLEALEVLRCLALQQHGSIGAELGQLGTRLLGCFNEDNVDVRRWSMKIFSLLLAAPGKKLLLEQAQRSLVPLCIHINEDCAKTAQTARDTLCQAAKLLGWKELQHLAKKADSTKIASCVLEKAGSALEPDVEQCVQHLRSPHVRMQEAAVRFLGILGRRLHTENPDQLPFICTALQSVEEDSEPAVRCLAQQTLLILDKLEDVQPREAGPLRRWLQRMCGN